MDIKKTIYVSSLLVSAFATSTNANANAAPFEGVYVMNPGCTSVSLTAGIGYAVVDPVVGANGISFGSIGEQVSQTITLDCETATIDESEVAAYEAAASAACQGLTIPWQTPEERAEYCDALAEDAVDSIGLVVDYFLAELVYSIDVDIVNDYWIGGLGQMDYVFANGTTEHRGPNVAVWNSGRFYRGFEASADTPNPLGCPSTRLGRMDANMDRSSSFGGGARMYLDTNIVDGVVCPAADIVGGNLLFVGYGFAINIKQQGDRL